MSAPSQTGIVNAALTLLGTSRRILDIGEGSPVANLYKQIWDATLDEVLADHPWNFAVRRVDAALSPVAPTGSQWSYRFERPAAMLRWLPWARDEDDWFDGEEEDGFILANDTTIVVRGIFRIVDPARWTPGFKEALAAKLAAKTAKAITGQSGMIDRMDAHYAEAKSGAKRQDGLATGQRDRRASWRSNWIDARNGGPI